MIRFLIFLFTLGMFSPLWGQEKIYPILNYTTDNGLPSNTIYSIFSDAKGYLWIATDKGISRYNGISFKNFTTSDGLSDNEVFNLKEDPYGRLWIANFKGDLSYYANDSFHNASNTPWLKLSSSTPSFHSHFIIGKDSSLICYSSDGKYFVVIKGEEKKLYDISSLRKGRPLQVSRYGVDKFRLNYNNESIIIDTNGHILKSQTNKFGSHYTTANSNQGLYQSTPQGIVSLSDELLYRITFIPFDSANRFLYFDRQHSFIGFRDGLLKDNSEVIVKGPLFSSVSKSFSGDIWASTVKNGLFRVSKNIDDIRISFFDSNKKVLVARQIGGTLYFITSEGDYYKLAGSKPVLLYRSNLPEAYRKALSKYNFLITERAEYILMVLKANIVVSGADKHKAGLLHATVFKKDKSLTIKEIIKQGDNLFVSSISTLAQIDLPSFLKGQFKEKILVNSANDFDHRIFTRAVNPADSSLWFSRGDGIHRVAGDGPAIFQKQFGNFNFRQFQFLGGYLIGFNASNTFFICNQVNETPVIDSLPNGRSIWENIYPIDNHRALISTNGYYRLLTTLPPAADGHPKYRLKIVENVFVPQGADCITADTAECVFFKSGKITRIATRVLFEETTAPATLFTGLKTGNKARTISDKVTLSYGQSNNINIAFDVISFDGKEITSQYSITKNGNENWVDITGNEINLNSPGYGTFTIKVRSKTLSSAYSRPAILTLQIEKPFWATWWFIAIAALALLGLIWAVIIFVTWRKLRKKQKEHEADMKFQQSEYKALNALMNPHFIFNSLNNIQGLINKDEKRTANEYLVIFSDLVRQNMHNVSKGFISLQEELTLIENYLTLEKLRFKELVNYNIKIEEDVDVDDIMIPPLMIQPLVENAVKHGLLPMQSASARVSIEVYEREDILYIIVEDNGIGLTASLKSQNKLHESFGLSNLQKRTDHLKKIQQHELHIEVNEMKDSDGIVLGTKAVVTIRLN